MPTTQLKTLKLEDVSVRRDLFERTKEIVPIGDLSGKGVFDSISSNQSKMNDQKS